MRKLKLEEYIWIRGRFFESAGTVAIGVHKSNKESRKKDHYRWEFLRRNSRYKNAFDSLYESIDNKENPSEREIQKILSHCSRWSISYPLDFRVVALPVFVRFEPTAILHRSIISGDDQGRIQSVSEMLKLNISKLKERSTAEPMVLTLAIDLRSTKPTALDLNKLISDEQKRLGIKPPKGTQRLNFHDLDKCLKVLDLASEGKKVTQIAREVYDKGVPHERTSDVKSALQRATILVEMAPHLPF